MTQKNKGTIDRGSCMMSTCPKNQLRPNEISENGKNPNSGNCRFIHNFLRVCERVRHLVSLRDTSLYPRFSESGLP